MGCNIRYATIKDAKLLGEIYTKAYCSAYKGLVPDSILKRINSRYMKHYFNKVIAKNLERVALVFQDGEIAGFMSFGSYRGNDLDHTWGEIMRIYLLRSFIGKGIGTECLNWCINELKDMGYKKICLWVFMKNTKGRKLYEKFNFIHDGKIKTLNLTDALTW